ncbi:PepSY-associated TM helix domain-containing protein [Compostibacter hankyongensis]
MQHRSENMIREPQPTLRKQVKAVPPTAPRQRKKRKSLFRRISAWLHLWLGLISGIIVLIVSLTGAVYVFQPQAYEAFHRQALFVPPGEGPVLPLDSLWNKAQRALGTQYPISSVATYKAPDRAWEFLAIKTDEEAPTYFGYMEYYYTIYLNPRTGEVSGIIDNKYEFFNIVKFIHWSLLLSTELGQPVVGWSTLIFVLMLITGLVLWWPKKWTRANRERSFKVRWTARWKRLNYDLHNVLGFYSLLLALVIAITGLTYSFQWVNKAFLYLTTGQTTYAEEPVVKSPLATEDTRGMKPLDRALATAWRMIPDAGSIITSGMPGEADGSILMSARMTRYAYYKYNVLYFSRYSGTLLSRDLYRDKSSGEKLSGMNYDIHVGTIGGLPTQVLALMISLICASLPVTGFYVWWNKKRQRKKHIPPAV